MWVDNNKVKSDQIRAKNDDTTQVAQLECQWQHVNCETMIPLH